MGDEKQPVFYCPYCTDIGYKGVPARTNLHRHVKSKHPDKYREFKKIPEGELVTMEEVEAKLPGTRIVEPQPNVPIKKIEDTAQLQKLEQQLKEKEEKNRMLQQQMQQKPDAETQPTYTLPVAPLPSYVDELPPSQFLQKFLEHYQCKKLFVMMMIDSVNMTGHPPDTATLVQALKNMDSNHNKTPLQAEWIGQMYDARLQQYWKRQNELKQARHMVARPPNQPYGAYPSTYPSMQTTDPYYQQPHQMGQYPRNPYEDQIKQLQEDVKRSKERDEQYTKAQMDDLKRQLAETRTSQNNPQLSELQRQHEDTRRMLQTQTEENQRLREQMQNQQNQAVLNRIDQIQNQALAAPSPEQITNMIQQGITRERDRFTGTDLKQYVDTEVHKLETQRGTTQMDVELKKAEHDLEKTRMEIGAESKKTEVWGENLKSVADVAAEALGRGLATVGGQQPTTQQPVPGDMPPPGNQILCPSCGTQLQLPPGVTDASCGKCRAQFTMGADGIPQLIGQRMPPPIETPPPTTQAGFTVETDAEGKGPDKLPEGMHVQHAEEPPTDPSQVVREPEREFKPTGREHEASTKKEPQGQPPETSLGNCPECGRPVYDSNIGKTEKGHPYHRECV